MTGTCWLTALSFFVTRALAWGYPYDNTWPNSCFAGLEQSPLDLPAYPDVTREELPLSWNTPATLHVTHDYNLQWADADVAKANTLEWPVGELHEEEAKTTYYWVQTHCHTGSENFVEGYQYAGECHFVHLDVDTDSKILVIGQFLDTSEGTESSYMNSLMDQLPSNNGWPNTDLTGTFSLIDWLGGADLTKYWSYMGSLTTPPCTEGVQFVILVDPLQVTTDQITKMQDASGFDNNFRPPQDLNGRDIEPHATPWGYPYDASSWGGVCETGTQQSPVDLQAYPGTERAEIPISWDSAVELTATHGHNLKWAETSGQSEANSVMWPPTEEGHVQKEYFWIQTHCHTGSENFLEGNQYEGECHFVHASADGSLLVVGVFLEVGETANDFLASLMDQLPDDDSWDSQDLTGSFVIAEWLDQISFTKYWNYHGSLTTPPCSEGVQFIILEETLEVTADQITKMENASGFDNNFRPPQELNGRIVNTGVLEDGVPSEDDDDDSWDLVAGILGGLAVLLLCLAIAAFASCIYYRLQWQKLDADIEGGSNADSFEGNPQRQQPFLESPNQQPAMAAGPPAGTFTSSVPMQTMTNGQGEGQVQLRGGRNNMV